MDVIKMTELTQELIRSLFEYHNGFLYWKISKTNSIKIGDKVSPKNHQKYCQVGINGKRYYNYQIIYLYHKGYLPKYIDHIDNDSLNNRIENLREITLSQNQGNRKPNKNSSSSKYKGVSWFKPANKWRSRITKNSKQIHLGYFVNETEAAKAYNNKAMELFGEYANLNEF